MIADRADLMQLAERHHALVTGDSAFQRQARVLQSIWRESKGYPIGEHRGMPLGSRLPMPWAEQTLANYLTPTIRAVVRQEVMDRKRARGKVYQPPRIFNDLLSSQPLAFNLFGELQCDLPLAARVFGQLSGGRMSTVTGIEFEYSPGRHDCRYTDDGTAFDVYVEYKTNNGRDGFVGIEIKYHENLRCKPARIRGRHDQVASMMQCFTDSTSGKLRASPLEQIWRDHLLAGSLLQTGQFDEGFYVFAYPESNNCCTRAVEGYASCLQSADTFAAWTLEQIARAIKKHSGETWVDELIDRYLNFGKLVGA